LCIANLANIKWEGVPDLIETWTQPLVRTADLILLYVIWTH